MNAHHDTGSNKVFGFWLYLMSDCVLFATLFAAFAVLHKNTFGGVGVKEVASLGFIFVETMFLLFSSFTFGLAFMSFTRDKKDQALMWLGVTFLLGLAFLGMELYEFAHLIHTGNSWERSAFLTSFFVLVGTHGLHVFFGLIWMLVTMSQLKSKTLEPKMRTRMACLGLFWHFLDLVWIFVFTVVYLMGGI